MRHIAKSRIVRSSEVVARPKLVSAKPRSIRFALPYGGLRPSLQVSSGRAVRTAMREFGDLRAREIYHGARLPRSTDSFLLTFYPDTPIIEPNSLIGPVLLSVEAPSKLYCHAPAYAMAGR